MLELINSRRSVRKWKKDAVPKNIIQEILEAGMNAPSAGNQQAWEFVVLEGKRLDDYQAINTNCPKGAPTGILVCGDPNREKYAGYYVQDCSAAIQNILLAVHAKKLGGVWTTVFPQNADKTRELLNIPATVVPFGFVAFGVPEKDGDAYRTRYDEKMVHWNRW